MKKSKSQQLLILIILFILVVKEISSPSEILNKFSSLKTKNNHIFLNISDFKYEENIYLEIKSEYKCEDYISYQFLDEIYDINDKLESKFTSKPEFKLKKALFGSNKFSTSFYTIVKRSDLIFNSKDYIQGNILYLEFKCIGEVEITNTKTRYEDLYSNLLLYFVLCLFFIFVFLILKAVVYSIIIVLKNKSDIIIRNWAIQNNVDNIFYINQIQANMNSPEERVVYVDISQDKLDMKINRDINSQNNNLKNYVASQYKQDDYNIPNNNYIKNMNEQNFPRIDGSDCSKV